MCTLSRMHAYGACVKGLVRAWESPLLKEVTSIRLSLPVIIGRRDFGTSLFLSIRKVLGRQGMRASPYRDRKGRGLISRGKKSTWEMSPDTAIRRRYRLMDLGGAIGAIQNTARRLSDRYLARSP